MPARHTSGVCRSLVRARALQPSRACCLWLCVATHRPLDAVLLLYAMALVPGTRLVVRFLNDPGYWHERLVLWPVTRSRYVILTGDLDCYVEEASDWEERHVLNPAAVHYPAVVAARNWAYVQFIQALDEEAVVRYVKSARRMSEQELAVDPTLVRAADPTHVLSWNGDHLEVPVAAPLRRARGKVPLEAAGRPLPLAAGLVGGRGGGALPQNAGGVGPLEAPTSLEAPAGFSWLVSEPGHAVALGEAIKLEAGDYAYGNRGMKVSHGSAVPVELVADAGKEGYRRER